MSVRNTILAQVNRHTIIDKPMIDQTALNHLIVTHSGPGPSTSLANLLDTNGYSAKISDVDIHVSHENNLDLSGCQFSKVKFSGEFNNKTFENVEFQDSHFAKVNFASSTFNHVIFDHCQFEDSNFKQTSHNYLTLKEGTSWGSNFSDSSFYKSNINDFIFSKSKFENVFEQDNKIEGTHFIFNQDVPPDYAFQQASFHEITPKVTIVEDEHWYSTRIMLLKIILGIPSQSHLMILMMVIYYP